MTSPPRVQWAAQTATSKSKHTTRRPQFARHGTSEVASTARGKLGDQADRPEHDLRLLVGHANTLDYLMERLYARQQRSTLKEDAEKAEQQESSEDENLTLDMIPEADDGSVPTEQPSLEKDQEKPSSGTVTSPEESADNSYFNLRDDKNSLALSIVELLDSDGNSDGSEDGNAEEDSGHDSDSS